MGWFRNNKELQFGTCGPHGKSPANQEKQRGEMLFHELGRGSCKRRVHWRKLKVRSTVTSLADLLPAPIHWAGTEQGGIFSSSCWDRKVVSLPVGDARYLSSCSGPQCVRSDTCFRFLPFSLTNQLITCLLINFHTSKSYSNAEQQTTVLSSLAKM